MGHWKKGMESQGISLPTPECFLLSESESGPSSDSLDALGKDVQSQVPQDTIYFKKWVFKSEAQSYQIKHNW